MSQSAVVYTQQFVDLSHSTFVVGELTFFQEFKKSIPAAVEFPKLIILTTCL